ncbi:MAG: 16S rRNA (cytosine(1402)-N(4))-methyltransferase RsmH [Patescibacteria group bacterium]
MTHIPVLQKEVIEYLDPKPNENFIDCTVGGGGHASAILERTGPKGKLLGIDWDAGQIKNLKPKFKNFGKRTVLINDNYANLKKIVSGQKFGKASGILLDLGFSSWHMEESERGFSFSKREPLDMRYDLQNPLTAEKIINYWSEADLEKIFREYGEEQFSKQIAKSVIDARRVITIENTLQLVEIIKKAVPAGYQHGKIHFATKTFQALRIAVNGELDNLEKVLPQILEILKTKGRIVIISFHSLEDRIVKNFYNNQAKEGLLEILTKKPVQPGNEEITINPRARSAKLRAAQKNEISRISY